MGVIWQSELTERQKTVWWLLLAIPSSLSHHTTPFYWKLRMTNPLCFIKTVHLQTPNSALSQSWQNMVNTVTRLQAAWFRVGIPAGATHFSLLQNVPPGPTHLLLNGYHRLVPRGTTTRERDWHSSPSSAKVKHKWSSNSTLLYAFLVCTGTTVPLPSPSWHQMSLARSHSHPLLKVLCCQHITDINYKCSQFTVCDMAVN